MDCAHTLLLLGVTFITLPIAIVYTYGNLVTYIFSVIYSSHTERKGDIDPSWLIGVFLASYSLGMFAIDVVKRKFGLMMALTTGTILMLSGIATSYFSVKHSTWAISLTYMFVGGIGDGMVYGMSMFYMAISFEDHVGLASAVPQASGSAGGVVLNQLLTRYINPDNLSPNGIIGDILYFKQPSIVSRVPLVFLLFAGIIAVCHSSGLALILISLKFTKKSYRRREEASETSNLCKEIETDSYTFEKENGENPADCTLESAISIETSVSTGCDSSIEQETSNENISKLKDDDTKPLQALKSIEFYIIWLSCFSETFCTMVDANYYKLFGQTWIKDDIFLAFIGSWSSVVSCAFQLGCGYFIDKFGAKNALIGHLAISSFFLYLWYFTAMTSKWLFLIWSNVLQSVHNNSYVSFPVFVFKVFGQTHYTTNIGLMFTAMILGTLVSPPLSSFILSSYGWFWLFFFSGTLPFLSLVLTVILMPSKG